jgi:hypothetical protein
MKVSPPVKFPGSVLDVGIVHLSSGVCDVGHSRSRLLKMATALAPADYSFLASPTVCEASKHFLINARLLYLEDKGVRLEAAGIS